jgi:hypothetical protein
VERDRDGFAPGDYSAALRASDYSVPVVRLDGLIRVEHWEGPESLHLEAHSGQVGCPVDPCLASPVFLEALV